MLEGQVPLECVLRAVRRRAHPPVLFWDGVVSESRVSCAKSVLLFATSLFDSQVEVGYLVESGVGHVLGVVLDLGEAGRLGN